MWFLYFIIVVEFIIIIMSLRYIILLLDKMKKTSYRRNYYNNSHYKNYDYNKIQINHNNIENHNYDKKQFMTNNEKNFFDILNILNDKYIVIPQVPLSSVINKNNNNKYRSELFRNVDFGIFTKNYELLLLIELNDSSHNNPDRIERDKKVKQICKDADIPLLTFHTKYPNTPEYVIRRINNKIIEITKSDL